MRFETEGVMFPFDFGFIPSTLERRWRSARHPCTQGRPRNVGCLIEVRVIGVITAEQIEDGNRETNNWLRVPTRPDITSKPIDAPLMPLCSAANVLSSPSNWPKTKRC